MEKKKVFEYTQSFTQSVCQSVNMFFCVRFKRVRCITNTQLQGNYCCYYDKILKLYICCSCALDVLQQGTKTSCWTPVTGSNEQGSSCSVWLKVDDCSKISCTWRLKADSWWPHSMTQNHKSKSTLSGHCGCSDSTNRHATGAFALNFDNKERG